MIVRYVQRAVILPVVLMVLVLLALLGAMFSLRINADFASTQAMSLKLQTRLAAEAGVERVKLLLQDARFDMEQWYHNPELLHRIIVWTPDGNESVWGSNEEFDEPSMTFRFSIVADDPADDEDHIRIGITDEASKLNLNTAKRRQLMILVRASIGGDPEFDAVKIVDAIIDWRDGNSEPSGEEPDTEGAYYLRLPHAYRIKNGRFDTVEELLLVKGVTGRVLYGEDFDRNGLLTPNEDDGDESFPPDNQDGVLNRGIYPYLTVHSAERIVSNENRRRVYLLGDAEALRSELEEAFPDEPSVVDFIISVTRQSSGRTGGRGSNNADNAAGGAGLKNSQGADGDDRAESDDTDENQSDGGDGVAGAASGDDVDDGPDIGDRGDGETNDEPDQQGPILSVASLLRDRRSGSTGSGQNPNTGILISPLTVAHLPALLDRTTLAPAEQQVVTGLINVNTAPPIVLRCVDGLNMEQVEAIVAARSRVSSEDKRTTAWLLEREVVDLATFERIDSQITARAQQFTIESLGYADHVGIVTRLQVVVDLLGPIAQTIYYRDLSYLGSHYPIREEDLEDIREQ